ncbi:hypothetical protein RHMOL_Rhmol11G0187800 [Rhododendron molle]|uniref:Uncharacterized protein n=1 Tax=Rhododendron molle TaxID=49168 RepID=A0ACC0LUC7_RHOML|nr:hypothetical protein RHMOL_Rhmol11G0187800 [Rhododendron molle]
MGYSVQKLREKFTRLKHELSVFKDLKDRSGFGWDPVRQTVTAPEPVWQEYLQDAKQFKSKGLDHYDLLVELCESTLATGAFAGYPSTLGGPTAKGEREMMRQGKSIRMADQMSMDSRGKRKSDGTGGSSSKSIKIDERTQAYATFGYAQQKKGEYFEKMTVDQFSVLDCIQALDEIASWFDEEQYYKAYEKLAFGPPTGRQGFMGLSIDRRTNLSCNGSAVMTCNVSCNGSAATGIATAVPEWCSCSLFNIYVKYKAGTSFDQWLTAVRAVVLKPRWGVVAAIYG